MNLSRVVVIVAVTAAIVYAGLNFLLPRGNKSPAAETVAATDASPAPESAPAAEATEVAAAAPEATTDTATDAPAEAATAEDPALTEEEARRIAANVAAEVAARVAGEAEAPAAETPAEAPVEVATETAVEPVAEPAPEVAAETMPEPEVADELTMAAPTEEAPAPAAADVGSTGLTEEQARMIAANVAREIAAQSGGVVEEEAPAATMPAPQPAPSPKPAPKPAPVAAAEPVEAPVASTPKAPKPVSTASTGSSAPKRVQKDNNAPPSGKTGNGADVISAWWKKSGNGSDRLNLVYAGEASSEKAVVLLFDGAVDAATAGSQIKLIDAKGGSPAGEWTSGGSNPRLIAFKGVKAGRYTVIVGAGMADTGGKSVGSELVGPVYVH